MFGTVKVADFGLSEDIYNTNYFRLGKSREDMETKVPIRWMPLESIEEGLYTEKSDVVSMYTTTLIIPFHHHCCCTVVIRCDCVGDFHLWKGTVLWYQLHGYTRSAA